MDNFIPLPPRKHRILIPIASSKIQYLSFGLYNPGVFTGKMFKKIAQIAAQFNLLKILGLFMSAKIQKLDVSEEIGPIMTDSVVAGLRRSFEKILNEQRISMAFSLGTPSIYRKVTILIFDDRSTPLAYAKIGFTSQSRKLIENECEALKKVISLNLKRVDVPRLLGSDKFPPVTWMMQSVLFGSPSSSNLTDDHKLFLGEFNQSSTQKIMPVKSWIIWQILQDQNRRLVIKNCFQSETEFIRELHRNFINVRLEDADRTWLFAAAHGDFAPWNMQILSGKIAVFDWEYYLPLAPIGWDLVHFIIRTENLLKRRSLKKIWLNFKSGAYSDEMISFEKLTGLTIHSPLLLFQIMLLTIAYDIIPELICMNENPINS